MRLGLQMKSEITQVKAVRWGLVDLPFLTCDCCRERIIRHEIAAGVTAYRGLEDYETWEWEFLHSMDVGLVDEEAGPKAVLVGTIECATRSAT
ncbi:MAG: hypothetical protein ABS79_01165 [Planctomycetes bacterium SCN 63-9]|nr:MAG: hypothetical protein ABS79_01165 [Planctomycetes bacterium SCN 63-9]